MAEKNKVGRVEGLFLGEFLRIITGDTCRGFAEVVFLDYFSGRPRESFERDFFEKGSSM